MIGLITSIVIFCLIALWKIKRLSKNQIVHIIVFTVAFQMNVDFYVDIKYHGYWYFTQDANWVEQPSNILLVSPVNLIFIEWFPFGKGGLAQGIFIVFWEIFSLSYEALTLLPEPWGYFHYGWWKLWISALINPFLLLILLAYYKWVLHLEKELALGKK